MKSIGSKAFFTFTLRSISEPNQNFSIFSFLFQPKSKYKSSIIIYRYRVKIVRNCEKLLDYVQLVANKIYCLDYV